MENFSREIPPLRMLSLNWTSRQTVCGAHALIALSSEVKIFNPQAKSCTKTIKDAYKYHESIKQNRYEKRIRETEHSSFNALVFACLDGAEPSASRVMKQLRNQDQRKTRRAVRRHYKLHPNENQLCNFSGAVFSA